MATPEIVTPSFTVIKASKSRKRNVGKQHDDDGSEDIRDETVARVHAYYEQLERKLHAAFLSNRPPAMRNAFLDTDALPDTFVVRIDTAELKSDPLPPPPRILRTPARFLNGAVGGGTGTKKASANVVTRLPADLSTLLPIRLGILNVLALGRIVAQPGYFTERYLYPVGFLSEREYVSGLDPAAKTLYRSEIRDGPSGPMFYVTAADDAGNPVRLRCLIRRGSPPTNACTHRSLPSRHPSAGQKSFAASTRSASRANTSPSIRPFLVPSTLASASRALPRSLSNSTAPNAAWAISSAFSTR